MITEERLEELLIKHGYDKKVVNNLVSKITLLKKGQEKDIDGLLTIIKATNLDINKCGMLLSTGKPKEVQAIIELLHNKVNLNKCISVLARCKYQDVLEFVKLFEDRNINIQQVLSVIARGDINKVIAIMSCLEEKNINPERCMSLLANGNLDEIQQIILLLEKEKINIEKCLSVLFNGKARDIQEIIEYLKSENIDVRKCPIVLARGNLKEIEKIVVLLKKHKLNINNCLIVLAYGKYDELVKLIPLLSQRVNLNGCLSLLAYCKYENTKRILDLLDENNIDASNSIIDIMRIDSKEVEKIIKLLKNNDIDVATISSKGLNRKVFRTYRLNGLNDLLDREKDKTLSTEDIQFLFQIRDGTNKYYNLMEIEQLCRTYSITKEQFIYIFCKTASNDIGCLQDRLSSGKNIWVGDTYPLTKEDLSSHQDIILTVTKYSVSKFMYLTGISLPKSDLEGMVLDILIDRCGGLFYNYKDDPKVLSSVLIKYCSKSLYTVAFGDDYTNEKMKPYSQEGRYFDDEFDLLSKISFTPKELEFLSCMNELVDSGVNNFVSPMLGELNIDTDEYGEILNSIRLKITNGANPHQLAKKLGKYPDDKK